MAKEIKFRVKLNVDGKDWLVTATSTTKELQHAIDGAKRKADPFNKAFMDIANVSSIVNDVTSALGQMSNALGAVYQSSLQVTQLTGKMGECPAMSGEARVRKGLRLPGKQEEYVKALAATGKPVVLVIMGGRPQVVENIKTDCAA